MLTVIIHKHNRFQLARVIENENKEKKKIIENNKRKSQKKSYFPRYSSIIARLYSLYLFCDLKIIYQTFAS